MSWRGLPVSIADSLLTECLALPGAEFVLLWKEDCPVLSSTEV